MKEKDDKIICAYGAVALLQQVKNLKKEWEGVHSGEADIEYVHRMRVATRRFRSIFEIFEHCFPKKKRGAWKAEVVRLTKALSKARDLDVHIAMLSEFSQTLPKPQQHAGISRLKLRLEQDREHVQPKLMKNLDRIRKKGVLDDIENSLKKITVEPTDSPVQYSNSLYQMAFKAINRCMNRLLSYDGRIQNPKNVEDLHAMRLEAKSLRYTIEIFQQLYTDQLESQLAFIEDMQSQLGDIHDDDIWLINLEKFSKAERKRTRDFYGSEAPYNLLVPGLKVLEKARKANRDTQYKHFIKNWEKLKEENLWGSLYQATKLPTIIYQPEPEEDESESTEEPIEDTQTTTIAQTSGETEVKEQKLKEEKEKTVPNPQPQEDMAETTTP